MAGVPQRRAADNAITQARAASDKMTVDFDIVIVNGGAAGIGAARRVAVVTDSFTPLLIPSDEIAMMARPLQRFAASTRRRRRQRHQFG
jgi:hypothetical protein